MCTYVTYIVDVHVYKIFFRTSLHSTDSNCRISYG